MSVPLSHCGAGHLWYCTYKWSKLDSVWRTYYNYYAPNIPRSIWGYVNIQRKCIWNPVGSGEEV